MIAGGNDAKLKYSQTANMDYPSISYLKQKMKENKILPIIAAVDKVKGVYESIQKVTLKGL